MKKLHVFRGHCAHYSVLPGGVYACDSGLDVRALTGGPDTGWLRRIPCVTSTFTDKERQVHCEQREFPTEEQILADQASMESAVRAIINGACPECGAVLRLRETDDVQLQGCPNGHVSSRGCKRIGDHLE